VLSPNHRTTRKFPGSILNGPMLIEKKKRERERNLIKARPHRKVHQAQMVLKGNFTKLSITR